MRINRPKVLILASSAVGLGLLGTLFLMPGFIKNDISTIQAAEPRQEKTASLHLATAIRQYLRDHRKSVPVTVHADLTKILNAAEVNAASEARITSPKNNAQVSGEFQVEGTVSDSNQLWLAVEWGGLIWPKEPHVPFSSKWKTTVFEGGEPPNGDFTLSLWLVPTETEPLIQRWFEEGRRSGRYDGLKEIPGGRRVDQVKLTLR